MNNNETNNNTVNDKIIEDAIKCHNLILNNNIKDAEAIVKPYVEDSVYYALIYGVIKTLDVMTLDHDKLVAAHAALTNCLKLADKKRRHGLSRFVFKQDYDSYTDEEVNFIVSGDCSLSCCSHLELMSMPRGLLGSCAVVLVRSVHARGRRVVFGEPDVYGVRERRAVLSSGEQRL